MVGVLHSHAGKTTRRTTPRHTTQIYAQRRSSFWWVVVFLLQAVMFPPRALFSLWLLLVPLEQRPLRASGAKQPGTARQIGGGTFSTGDRMRCAWSAGEAGEAVKVWVSCVTPGAPRRGGVTKSSCEYLGRPRGCPGYNSDPNAFWKQVARAFKKLQNKVCVDGRALVKAGMCKRAPRDVHLRLDQNSVKRSTTAPTAPPPHVHATTTACAKRRTAEEYCGSSWASVCAFFMTMLQSNSCESGQLREQQDVPQDLFVEDHA
ncbi:fibroblast growth factor-binding protein 1 [Anableps anableps]